MSAPYWMHEARKDRTSWLQVTPCVERGRQNPSLVMLLDEAREAQRLIYTQRGQTVSELAYSVGRKPQNFSRLIRLNHLAPDIVTAIVDGRQPRELTRGILLAHDLPLDWALQRRQLGFSALEQS